MGFVPFFSFLSMQTISVDLPESLDETILCELEAELIKGMD